LSRKEAELIEKLSRSTEPKIAPEAKGLPNLSNNEISRPGFIKFPPCDYTQYLDEMLSTVKVSQVLPECRVFDPKLSLI
jgi:hypothetical protein